ncbi:MAG: spore maturation protein [Clostridiales bacterium]|nr:spore maturation protein [Clostridiales bacterium]
MMEWISRMLIPLTVGYIISFGLISRRPVFDDFLDGAKEGMQIVVGVLPSLLGLMTAAGVLRSSGFMDALGDVLAVPAARIHFPAELVPITLVRLVSNSAATGLLLDLFKTEGPDSPVGMAASVMLCSTETVFYCISIYFGSVQVSKTRYTIPGAFVATAVGIWAAVALCC